MFVSERKRESLCVKVRERVCVSLCVYLWERKRDSLCVCVSERKSATVCVCVCEKWEREWDNERRDRCQQHFFLFAFLHLSHYHFLRKKIEKDEIIKEKLFRFKKTSKIAFKKHLLFSKTLFKFWVYCFDWLAVQAFLLLNTIYP